MGSEAPQGIESMNDQLAVNHRDDWDGSITIIHIISNARSNSCYESTNSCYDRLESTDLRLLTVDQSSKVAHLAADNPRPKPGRGQIEAGQEPRSGKIGLWGDLSPGPKLKNSFSEILRLSSRLLIPGVPFSRLPFLKTRSPKFPGGNF